MNCPHCASPFIKEQTRKTSLGYRAFRCSNCKRTFNERTGPPFNYLEYHTDLVLSSRRGAPEGVNNEGLACPNRKCPYCGITDAPIHALVGDGTHGRAERIQTFRGPACRTTFNARGDTPL